LLGNFLLRFQESDKCNHQILSESESKNGFRCYLNATFTSEVV